MKLGTRLIHNGNEIDKATGALSVPIYQVSTFHQWDIDEKQEYEYARSENPTRRALEETIAQLEGGDAGFAFSSGMAATSAALSLFSAGDHILLCKDIYGGTFRAASQIFSRFGITSSFVDVDNPGSIKAAIRENTKGIFLETPSNPLLKITDLKGVIEAVKSYGLLVIVDNTFMTPYLQRPLEFGADIVLHSATKFIGGHSDVVAGLAVVKGEKLAGRLKELQNGLGSILGPQDSWLLLRGLKTLKVRLDYQQATASKLARFLSKHEGIVEVFYPGLETHPLRDVHFAQADGAGAVLSFKTEDTASAKKFLKSIKDVAVAVSLGGVETIVSYPATMSHAAMPSEVRESLGITENLIRVSVGLEEYEDLVESFHTALAK